MAVNKVEINGKTIIDLTKDTVLPQTLLSGVTAHNAAGEPIVGAVAVAPASATLPNAPGEAAVGEENTFARGDHVHPKEVSDAERAAWNSKPSIVIAEIPKGRMRGDIKGTGKVGTTFDLAESGYYMKKVDPTNPAHWACDLNGDGKVNSTDLTGLKVYQEGNASILTKTPTFADYYNNWTYHKVDDMTGYWTTELSIPAITAEMGVSIICGKSVQAGTFIKAEPFAGGVRIYANYPPIEALPCEISYATGTGGQIIVADIDIPKALSFAVTLTAANWNGNAQEVNNGNFVASGYAYTVAPASGSFAAYASAVIYADDVTAFGEMTFHCSETPTVDLTVNILRVEVEA